MIQELGESLIPISAIACTFVFLVIWVVAATFDSLYKTRCNMRLKERLIELGASAPEIDRILRAGQMGEESFDGLDSAFPRVPPVQKKPLATPRVSQPV